MHFYFFGIITVQIDFLTLPIFECYNYKPNFECSLLKFSEKIKVVRKMRGFVKMVTYNTLAFSHMVTLLRVKQLGNSKAAAHVAVDLQCWTL